MATKKRTRFWRQARAKVIATRRAFVLECKTIKLPCHQLLILVDNAKKLLGRISGFDGALGSITIGYAATRPYHSLDDFIGYDVAHCIEV